MSTNANPRSVELRRRAIEPLINYVDRLSLVTLSRVCWLWNAKVNNVLWRRLQSLSPLLRLLSRRQEGNVWVRVRISVAHASSVAQWCTILQVLETPVRVSTLERFDVIAACVQSIEWSETGWTQEWLEVFAESALLLRAARPARDLLQNLRWFRANCETLQGVRTIVPWLSASLTNVDINLGLAADDAAGTYFLSALEGHSTRITSFSLRMDSSPSRRRFIIQALLGVLQGLRSVRKVIIPLHDSPGQHLDALGAAPHLEELGLVLLEPPAGDYVLARSTLFEGAEVDAEATSSLESLDDFVNIQGLPDPSLPEPSHITLGTTTTYPNLRILGVTGCLPEIVDIVQVMTRNLEQLQLTVPSIRHEHEMTQAMQKIAAFCPRLIFIEIEILSAEHHEWVDLVPLDQRPLEIHTRHPVFYPKVLVWHWGEDDVLEAQLLIYP